MHTFILLLITAVVSFVAGALVYRNNENLIKASIDKVDDQLDEFGQKVDTIENAIDQLGKDLQKNSK